MVWRELTQRDAGAGTSGLTCASCFMAVQNGAPVISATIAKGPTAPSGTKALAAPSGTNVKYFVVATVTCSRTSPIIQFIATTKEDVLLFIFEIGCKSIEDMQSISEWSAATDGEAKHADILLECSLDAHHHVLAAKAEKLSLPDACAHSSPKRPGSCIGTNIFVLCATHGNMTVLIEKLWSRNI